MIWLLGIVIGLTLIAMPFAVLYLLLETRRLRQRVLRLENRPPRTVPTATRTTTEVQSRALSPAVAAAPVVLDTPPPTVAVAKATPATEPTVASSAAAAEVTPPTVKVPLVIAAEVAQRDLAAPEGPPPSPPAPPKSPPKAPSGPFNLEEQLGARLSVWAGAIALALAGIFLVKYAVDKDLLGPALRVAMGVLFGATLVAGGEWARIRRSGRIGAGLSAAGIAVLYASFLAASDLYQLIPSLAAFGLMALTTATAVALSLRQGPLIAVVGLVGGFVTPYLLRSDAPASALSLFTYLLLLEAGLLAVGRRRGWWILSVVTLLGGLAWVGLWMSGNFTPDDAAVLYLFLAASVGLFLATDVPGMARADLKEPVVERLFALVAVALPLLAVGLIAASASFRTMDWAMLGLLGAGCLVLARRDATYEPIAWLAAGLTAFLLITWYADSSFGEELVLTQFILTTGALGAVYALGAYAALWGSVAPVRWAALSALSALAYFLVACVGLLDNDLKLPAAFGALALAAGMIALAVPVGRRRVVVADGTLVLAALATGATVFLSLAVPLALAQEWISVAWALEVPAVVWIARRLNVPVLRRLAWPLAILVGIRLLANPMVLDYPIGSLPGLNWLLYGYGVPIAAFVVAAVWSHQDGDERLSLTLQGLSIALGFAFLSLQVRQLFSPGALTAFDHPRLHLEVATYVVVWLGYALGLLHAGRRLVARALTWGGIAVTLAAIVVILLGTTVAVNPIMGHGTVGSWPVLNWLLYMYGLPAVLLFLAAYELRQTKSVDPWLSRGLAYVGMFEVFVLVTLLVRQAFRGTRLDSGTASLLEMATYCVIWLALGVALLELDRRRASRLAAQGGVVLVGVGLVATFVGPVIVRNPWLAHEAVGAAPGVNWLLYVYAVPAALLFLAAWELRRLRSFELPAWVANVMSVTGLILVFVWITLAVRQAFHGNFLDGGPQVGAERYAYSLAWMLYGLVLLMLGIRWGGRLLRYASLAVMMLAVAKVFLYDTRNLGDLYRVLSYLGLGISLFALAWLYQRFVFRTELGSEPQA
jgi:uncharacterized membrane protein